MASQFSSESGQEKGKGGITKWGVGSGLNRERRENRELVIGIPGQITKGEVMVGDRGIGRTVISSQHGITESKFVCYGVPSYY